MKSRAVLFALLYGFLLQSQDLTLKYEIKMQGMPAEMAVYSEMQGVNYFKGEQCRTEIENMMFSIKTYVNNQEAIFCQDMMDQKMYYKRTRKEIEAERAKVTDEPKIQSTQETKTILGYPCKKYTITQQTKDKSEITSEVWVTESLKLPEAYYLFNSRGNMPSNKLTGTVLLMETPVKMQGTEVKSIMRVTEVITTPLDAKLFKANTEGYTETTFLEMKNQMRGMGGMR